MPFRNFSINLGFLADKSGGNGGPFFVYLQTAQVSSSNNPNTHPLPPAAVTYKIYVKLGDHSIPSTKSKLISPLSPLLTGSLERTVFTNSSCDTRKAIGKALSLTQHCFLLSTELNFLKRHHFFASNNFFVPKNMRFKET